MLSEWRSSLASEPRLVRRKISEFRDVAGDEIRLHQEIFARFFKRDPARVP